MKSYRTSGIVLRTTKLGEADRIITLCTPDYGKVRAVAKGVRKSGSKFGARLEPLAEVDVQLAKGRNLDIVTQVETIASHRELREALAGLGHASCMAEAVDLVLLDHEPHPMLYEMFSRALHALAADMRPIVAAAFLWKLQALEGFAPLLDECARCGTASAARVGFSPAEGGVICERCIAVTGWRLPQDAFAALDGILEGRLTAVFQSCSETTGAEMERLAVATFEHHVERKLRSSALLV